MQSPHAVSFEVFITSGTGSTVQGNKGHLSTAGLVTRQYSTATAKWGETLAVGQWDHPATRTHMGSPWSWVGAQTHRMEELSLPLSSAKCWDPVSQKIPNDIGGIKLLSAGICLVGHSLTRSPKSPFQTINHCQSPVLHSSSQPPRC